MLGTVPKPLEWVGSSKKDLKAFPGAAQDHIGFALYQAQIGLKHRDTKPLKGFGPGVLEVVTDAGSDTYRTVYTLRFREAVYVLHAFQKKSKRGIATPQTDIELVRRRLRLAERHYRSAYGKEGSGK
ncbi:MAG: type II toxin-antitoxin system RelE/ParE family toxin [Candidatus Tectomicrobia bacterium]|uniref:Type II toxin-antitoxin system RelE/ParE family toxin n=1 Tax=Tectimicrobiota bacterium TaxID=2528274 RepID=A0A932ML94_UNCTE|nr:type II toxin-antitoxin system RelE/ParE family toxin [Candidatus Tectomicrobia bacterium]